MTIHALLERASASAHPALPSTPECPQLARRGFLGRAVAALAAGTAINAGAIVATRPAPLAVAEDAGLLAMGERIEPLLSAYRVAKERHLAARATAEALCPSVPEELVADAEKRTIFAGCWAGESDIEGITVYHNAAVPWVARKILQAEMLRATLAPRGFVSPRGKHGRRVKSLIKVAEAYERARAEAIERAGLEAATNDLRHTASEIDVLAWEMREAVPVTMAGVLIQARILAAHAESERDGSGMTDRAGLTLGRPLAEAVLRIAGASRGAA